MKNEREKTGSHGRKLPLDDKIQLTMGKRLRSVKCKVVNTRNKYKMDSSLPDVIGVPKVMRLGMTEYNEQLQIEVGG